MDFTRTEAQDDLAGLTRDICERLVTPETLRASDAAGPADPRLTHALAEAGVFAAGLPEPDGDGVGLLEQSAVLRELGRALAPVAYLDSIVVAADALSRFGSAEHADLPRRAAAGEIVLAPALEEPLGTDPYAPAATADEEGGTWVLRGSKTAVPFAAEAAAFLVSARIPGSDGSAGVFLVPAEEVEVLAQECTGHRSIGAVELDGVRVTGDALLGSAVGESGDRVLRHIVDRAVAGVCAEQLGILERSLELTAAYAREREQFGRPIGAFQAVAQRLADAFIDVKAARLTLEQAAWRLADGRDAADALHVAKFWAADAGHRVAHTTVHIHGGVGLDRDHPVHRYFLAAKHNEFRLGSATAQLRGIGSRLAS